MNAQPNPAETAEPEPDDILSEEHAQANLWMLQELAEIGMEMARLLLKQTAARMQVAAEPDGDDDDAPAVVPAALPGDPALVYSRIARAVRLSVALQERMRREIVAEVDGEGTVRGGPMAYSDEHSPSVTALYRALFTPVAIAAVEEAIEAETTDRREVERLKEALHERLYDEEDGYDGIAHLSIGEVVTLICQELGFTPDVSMWRNESWATSAVGLALPRSHYAGRTKDLAQPPIRPAPPRDHTVSRGKREGPAP